MTAPHWLDVPLFTLYGQEYKPLGLLLVLFLIAFGFWLAGWFKRKIMAEGSPLHMTMGTRTLVANLGRYLIVFVTVLAALNTLGVNLSSLTVVAGALSVGIGFGLQNIVNNLVSGIILMGEKSIRIGDTIEISDTMRGKVREIRMRSTIVTTFDNIDVIIPNGELIQNRVVNLTLQDAIRRLKIPFGVAYGTPVERVNEVILGALEKSGLNYYEEEGRNAAVWMSGMGASSVDFELIVWIKTDEPDRPAPLPGDFLVMIYNALNEARISIPFPQMDLHVIEPVRIAGEQ